MCFTNKPKNYGIFVKIEERPKYSKIDKKFPHLQLNNISIPLDEDSQDDFWNKFLITIKQEKNVDLLR